MFTEDLEHSLGNFMSMAIQSLADSRAIVSLCEEICKRAGLNLNAWEFFIRRQEECLEVSLRGIEDGDPELGAILRERISKARQHLAQQKHLEDLGLLPLHDNSMN
jgi:hypothetical protein